MSTLHARAVALRRLHLEIVVRLRRLGPLPWLLLLAWMLIAQGQEPKALRSFGIVIGPQAAWVGASMLLPLCFTAKRINGLGVRSTDLLANLLLLLLVAGGQAWLAFLIEAAIAGHAMPSLAARSTGYFVLAWLPFACSSARLTNLESRTSFASLPRVAIMVGTAFLGVGFGAHAWQHGFTPELLAAAALASLSGLLASTEHKTPK